MADKSQKDRLLNIGLYGPLLIFSSMNKTPPDWLRLLLLAAATTGILYDLNAFLADRKKG